MLPLVVFLNGMAVMVLEMAGARLLAPELGTSIVVWTSLIGVILASLSLGYWLGGKLADKRLARDDAKRVKGDERARRDKAYATLSNLLAAGAICVFVAALLGGIVPGFAARLLSLHLGAVCAAFALFALPSVLCGMVSPYAIRLAITSSDTSGATVGALYAVGTVGSIVGTFLGGFVLLSWFGSTTIIIGVAGCLLAAAALTRLRPLAPKVLLGLIFTACAVGDISYTDWIRETGFARDGIPVTIETSYSSMRVAKGREGGRDMLLLLTDPGSCQSGMYADDPAELAFAYTRFYGLGTGLNPDAKRILMLGGGGYSVPKWLLAGRSGLRNRDFSLDVVELDPGMTRTAERYFKINLSDPRMRVFHEDARTFINKTAERAAGGQAEAYDLVFADIFNSWYTVPFHVGTEEAARNIRNLLSDDGIYVMNIITAVSGDNGRLLRAIRNAFAAVFGEVHIFPVLSTHNGELVQNVMLMAFKNPRPLPDPARERVAPSLARLLAYRWTAPFPAPEDDVPALTDAYSPVERYTLGYLAN